MREDPDIYGWVIRVAGALAEARLVVKGVDEQISNAEVVATKICTLVAEDPIKDYLLIVRRKHIELNEFGVIFEVVVPAVLESAVPYHIFSVED